uniref:Succinate-semialdehyde dehydrogenase, mitochondrial n=1 Tax=Aceria tosichella TaxID=561515 RepID=A0A6G1SMZ5_9ACAR
MLGRLHPALKTTLAMSTRRHYATANNAFFQSQAYINGRWLESDSHQVFPVLNPATNEVIGEVADCDEQDFLFAAQAATKAFPSWSETTAKQRGILLRQMAEAQMANQKELAEILSMESGKPIQEAMGEIVYGASFFEWFADLARSSAGEILASPFPDKTMMYIRQAAGPVGIITPWNFPNAMITRKLGAALAAGCTAIIKPAPDTPYSALAIAKILDGLDIPEGVVNVIPASVQNTPKVGQHMCKSRDLKVISFTGSSSVGKLLLQQSASTVKRVCLELGGNAPFIVFESANLERAVDGYIASKFRNTGQTCVCANRCLVQDKVYDKFVEMLKAKMTEKLKSGDTLNEKTTVGSLINKAAVAKVQAHVQDALEKGGKLLLGGKSPKENHFEPTLIADAKHDMLCCQEETFGPLAAIVKFKTEEEALELANSVRFGLAAYFYSQDLNQVRRVSKRLESGMVGVNEGVISACEAPFGGVKESGLGREGSHLGLEEYQEVKYICIGP